MSSEVIFSEVSHVTDLKAEMTSRTKILTAKQQKSLKSLKKSGRKNHRWKRIKKIAGQILQSKELNEKLRSNLPDQQINCTMQAQTQTKSSQISENIKIKLNKNIFIAKTL